MCKSALVTYSDFTVSQDTANRGGGVEPVIYVLRWREVAKEGQMKRSSGQWKGHCTARGGCKWLLCRGVRVCMYMSVTRGEFALMEFWPFPAPLFSCPLHLSSKFALLSLLFNCHVDAVVRERRDESSGLPQKECVLPNACPVRVTLSCV